MSAKREKPPIADAAADLPVSKYADDIVAAVKGNPVTVVIGETGSGKTTQISQILYKANVVPRDAMIGITQPRRVAAVSVARCVRYGKRGAQLLLVLYLRFRGLC